MIRIAPAAPQEYEAALELLFDRLSPDERRISVKDVLRSLSGGRIVQHGLLTAWSGQKLAGSILYAIQRDRTAFVWPPRIRRGEADRPIADALVAGLRSGVDSAGAWIVQALLDPAAHDDADALDRNGFEYLTDLRFLVHMLRGGPPADPKAESPLEGDVEIVTYEPGRARRSIRATARADLRRHAGLPRGGGPPFGCRRARQPSHVGRF